MDPKLVWFAFLIIMSLVQTILLLVKLKTSKANDTPQNSGKSGNPGNYGERISSLETDVKGMKDNNDKDHSLIRQDIQKLFSLVINKRG